MLHDIAAVLRFYTRLPVPPLPGEADAYRPLDLDRTAYAVPLAGALVGLIGGIVLCLAAALGFGAFLAAALTVTATVLATGAFHEDGLADTADGLGGGRNREQRLVIMRDSRIGTYGGAALILAIALRIGVLQALILQAGPLRAAIALVAAEAASRVAGLLLLAALPPARLDGAALSVGRPSPDAALTSALCAALVVAVLLVPAFGVGATFAGLIGPLLALAVMIRQARRLIDGQTGDVAGATQQVAEIVFLLGVLIFVH